MKIGPRAIEEYIRTISDISYGALLYGPDAGRISEYATQIRTILLGTDDDPFRVTELQGADIKDDPARLNDEVSALSLTGGRRLVHLRGASDAAAARIGDALSRADKGAAFLLVTAGQLSDKSTLRKTFERARNAAAIACYAQEGQDLQRIIGGDLKGLGLTPDPDAVQYLAANLAGDRLLARRAAETIALYVGDGGRVTLEDARACASDGMQGTLDDVAFAVADGDHGALDTALRRLAEGSVSPIAALSATARHIQRLHRAAGLVAKGVDTESALTRLRPPAFWKQRPQMRRQLTVWTQARYTAALTRLAETDLAAKTTGAPQQALCERALHAIARLARGRRP